jgi:hypothetical protein
MLAIFGTHKAQYWDIIRRGHNNNQWPLQFGTDRLKPKLRGQLSKCVVLLRVAEAPW